ncbi:MAG TPA: glycosyltransferase family 1 protein, partial [Myxococcaceae bacterium]|nr:glycosyltransferase family 1 protein [Myxococcaceae bacterium]
MNELSGVAPHRIRVAELVNSLYLGGTEGQVVELLRCLRHRFDFRVAVLHLAGPLVDDVRGLGLVPQHFPPPRSLAHPMAAGLIIRIARWLRRERVEL